MKRISFFIILSALLLACGPKKSEYDALKNQNDSLMHHSHQMQEEVDAYFATMNRIEQNIAQIREQEGLLAQRTANIEQGNTSDIEQDLQSIQQILAANRAELDRLKAQVKKSALKSTELEQTIARLTREIEEQNITIARLGTEIARRDSLIHGMNVEIVGLVQNVENLHTENETKKAKIDEQDNAIHSAWYVYGTRRELKAQGIITGGGLFSLAKILQSDFDKTNFVRIDYRNTRTIELYSKKVKVLTQHPKSSYTLNKTADGYTIVISEPEQFWNVSKYLVIEVD